MSRLFQPADEFIELLQGVMDGELTPDEHHQLEELIRGDREARLFFTEFLQLHATLSHQAVGLSIDEEYSDSASVGKATDSVDTRHATIKPTSDLGRLPKRLFLVLPWALAAALLISLGLPHFFPRGDRPLANKDEDQQNNNIAQAAEARPVSRPPAPVATLTSNENAQWGDGPLVVGQPFHEGETIHLKQGQARVSVGFGAEIAARAPCLLTFLAADRVQLIEGEVFIDVAEWAKGFTIVTDKMDVVDLGTTFSVSASSEATVETSVLKGMVRALPTRTRDGEQRSVLLSEGEGLFVDELGNRRSFRQGPEGGFGEFDFGAFTPYRPVELHNTGLGLAEGDQDPYWRVVAGPKGVFQGPEFAQVCVPYKRYLHNEPEESQWVSIRNWEEAAANSVYTFETTFHLTGYDLSTMRLFGRFLADNGIEAVRVNGRAVRVESWVDNVYGQRFDALQFRFVNVTDGLVEGRNVIEIDVHNGTLISPVDGRPNSNPNHMALRVEWYAFGRQAMLVDERSAEKIREELFEQFNATVGRLPAAGFAEADQSTVAINGK